MTPLETFIAALGSRGLTVRGSAERGYMAQCPAHDDRTASLSISEGDDGRALIYCHAGCSTESILWPLGLEQRDLFQRDDDRHPTHRRSTATTKRAAPSSQQVAGWHDRLLELPGGLDRLRELRGWTREVICAHRIGWDGERVTLPVTDAAGRLAGVLRYQPNPERRSGASKMLAQKGTPRDLYPPPELTPGDPLFLVEGEPDAVTVQSMGLAAVAVPGANGWKDGMAPRFAGRHLVVCCDVDGPGRELAKRVAGDLLEHATSVRVLDLDPDRDDGYDVGDLVRDAARVGADGLAAARATLERMADTAVPLEPPPPPDLAALLADVLAFLRRYVVLPGKHEATALALFVLHTWTIEAAHATPYLLVTSPEKGSGKTRLLELLRRVVREAWHTNSTSEAALFRKIERDQPTLLLDEVDAVFASSSERTEPLRAVLNSGNRRGVTVTRCVGKEHELAEFSVFCAKVLAGIDRDRRLPETIRDRAITVRMRRRHDAEPVERLRDRTADKEAEPIRDHARRWAIRATADLSDAEPDLPDELGDRAADAWEPLFAIADMAGGDWPTLARTAAVQLSGNEPDETSIGTLLLAAVRAMLDGRDRITSRELAEKLNEDDELPFGGWRDGKGIDARGLARHLKPYGIKPDSIKLDGGTLKGYRRDDFRDAWTRYLPPSDTPTPPYPSEAEPPEPPEPAAPSSATVPLQVPDSTAEIPSVYRQVPEVPDVPHVTELPALAAGDGSGYDLDRSGIRRRGEDREADARNETAPLDAQEATDAEERLLERLSLRGWVQPASVSHDEHDAERNGGGR